MSAARRSRSVDASSLSRLLGGLPPQEEEVLGQLLALFPVPSPEHAAQVDSIAKCTAFEMRLEHLARRAIA